MNPTLTEENSRSNDIIDVILNCFFCLGSFILILFFNELVSRNIPSFSANQEYFLSIFLFFVFLFIFLNIVKRNYSVSKNVKNLFAKKKLGITLFLLVASVPVIHSVHLFLERNAIHKHGKIMTIDTKKLCDWHLYQHVNMVELLSLNSSDEVQRLIYRSTYADYRNGLLFVAFNAWSDESVSSVERYSKYHIKIKGGIISKELTFRKEKSY